MTPWLASGSLLAALPSMAAVAVLLAAIVWIAIQRPGLGLIFCFILFGFAWRLVSVLYIDSFGPLYSDQLERNIGSGTSALPIAISQGLVVIALLFSFRRQRVLHIFGEEDGGLASRLPTGRFSLSALAFWAAALFIAALWADLLVRGQIPLFAAIERFDYTRLHGGPLHRLLLQWGPMLALQLGVFFAVPLLYDRPSDRRFGFLFGTLIAYLFLAGHRFSSFYAYASFFVIPVGAVIIGREAKSLPQGEVISRKMLRRLLLGTVVLLLLIASAVFYSYIVVRGEGAVLFAKLSQRILVQQGEMWWMTYERVFLQGNWDGGLAAHKLFVDPFDPARNSTMQFLMENALPLERAHNIIAQGLSFTGGWPEVFFELEGPIGGFVLVALSAIAFSEFMFLMTRCIVQERFASCFFLTPILFTLSITIASGMVNSFVQVTFLVKVAIALGVYVTEDKWRLNLYLSSRSVFVERKV